MSGTKNSFVVTTNEENEAETMSTTQENNRLFVGNLSENCTREQLKEHFGVYGSLEKIVVIPDKFAFVTFDSPQAAQAALKAMKESSLYKVGYARDRQMIVKKQKRSEKENEFHKIEQRLDAVAAASRQTQVLVVQGNTSHLHRLQDFIMEQQATFYLQVIGSIPTGERGKLSLLFLEQVEGNEIDVATSASRLAQHEYLKPALNQVFVVSPKCHHGEAISLHNDDKEPSPSTRPLWIPTALHEDRRNNNDKMVLRVTTYPPRLQQPVTNRFNDYIQTKQGLNLTLSPTNFTHVYSLIQLTHGDGSGYYLVGLSKSTGFFGHLNKKDHGNGGPSSPPRAYYKLQEAFGRYRAPPDLRGKVAMDCGAAPGGWTRYLVENGCRQVYSIDPGELDSTVLGYKEEVVHLKMKTSDALQHLQSQVSDKPTVDIFVSDMCLHDMMVQVEVLLEAKPLLKPNAFFVLTLKCVAGYSKQSYDYQVDKVVEKLDPCSTGINTWHLFANRNAERTVLGYLK